MVLPSDAMASAHAVSTAWARCVWLTKTAAVGIAIASVATVSVVIGSASVAIISVAMVSLAIVDVGVAAW